MAASNKVLVCNGPPHNETQNIENKAYIFLKSVGCSFTKHIHTPEKDTQAKAIIIPYYININKSIIILSVMMLSATAR